MHIYSAVRYFILLLDAYLHSFKQKRAVCKHNLKRHFEGTGPPLCHEQVVLVQENKGNNLKGLPRLSVATKGSVGIASCRMLSVCTLTEREANMPATPLRTTSCAENQSCAMAISTISPCTAHVAKRTKTRAF